MPNILCPKYWILPWELLLFTLQKSASTYCLAILRPWSTTVFTFLYKLLYDFAGYCHSSDNFAFLSNAVASTSQQHPWRSEHRPTLHQIYWWKFIHTCAAHNLTMTHCRWQGRILSWWHQILYNTIGTTWNHDLGLPMKKLASECAPEHSR